jgi:hypothetical protein
MEEIKLLSGVSILVDNSAIEAGDWCIEMHNGDSRAELSYIDEKGNKWYLRKMNMNCSENDPECKRVIYPTNIEEF